MIRREIGHARASFRAVVRGRLEDNGAAGEKAPERVANETHHCDAAVTNFHIKSNPVSIWFLRHSEKVNFSRFHPLHLLLTTIADLADLATEGRRWCLYSLRHSDFLVGSHRAELPL
jgi:hypothetical protein